MKVVKSTYIKQLNAFAAASLEAGLGPNEGWLYMKLFWEANSRFWPEYIECSLADLKRLTTIKSTHTLLKARNNLVEKGFLKCDFTDRKKTRYVLIHMQNLHMQNLHMQKMHKACAENTQEHMQKMHKTYAKNAQDTPHQPSNTSASETSQDYKTNKTYKTIYNNSKNDTEINDDFREIIDCYCENISPDVSSYYSERLTQDMEAYGKDKLIAAMTKAAEMGKRSLAYAEGILKNKKGGEGSGKVKRRKAKEPKEADNFFDYLDEAIANQHYPWEDEEYTSV